jgi:Zinc-finger associated domain (zf-AD)
MTTELQNFCRCCLSMQTEVNDLVEMRHSIGKITILDMFLESSGVAKQTMIKTVDDAPKICKVCVELLKSAFYFRVLCRSADKALQESVKTTAPANSGVGEYVFPFWNVVSNLRNSSIQSMQPCQNPGSRWPNLQTKYKRSQ